MKNLLVVMIFLSLVFVGCSSTKEKPVEDKKNTDIQKDYLVKDASSETRPGWIEDAEVWARDNGKEIEKYRFFSYETEPKTSRGIACNLAKANAKADIAGEIATFIDKSLGESTQGDAAIDENNPKAKALKSYVENTLAEKVQALIHGASIQKTYWEKREYKESMGAKKDFIAFTCAVFIRMDQKTLADAVKEAANHVAAQTDDPELKDKVQKALAKADENFLKAKEGK